MSIVSREMIARSAEIPVEYFYTDELLSRLPKPIQTEKISLRRGSEVRPLLQESEDAHWLSQRTLRREFGFLPSEIAWLIEQRVLPPTRVQGIAAGWHYEIDHVRPRAASIECIFRLPRARGRGV